MNWGMITKAFIGLFLADLFAGFLAPDQLFVRLGLSLILCIVVFAVMAYCQDSRQFLRACVALLAYFAFSQILAAFLPNLAGSSLSLLVALGWLNSVVALVIGTSLGRLLSRTRRLRVDA
ncbi:MAG: hypothetical protein ABIU96_10025 [Rhodanobacter sp.]